MSTKTPTSVVLDVLQDALKPKTKMCAVGRWAHQQGPEVQEMLQKVADNHKSISPKRLYSALKESVDVPFAVTVFREHLSGVCSCQKI